MGEKEEGRGRDGERGGVREGRRKRRGEGGKEKEREGEGERVREGEGKEREMGREKQREREERWGTNHQLCVVRYSILNSSDEGVGAIIGQLLPAVKLKHHTRIKQVSRDVCLSTTLTHWVGEV